MKSKSTGTGSKAGPINLHKSLAMGGKIAPTPQAQPIAKGAGLK